jgi:hypothetical protein
MGGGSASSGCTTVTGGYTLCPLAGMPGAVYLVTGDFIGSSRDDLLLCDYHRFVVLEGVPQGFLPPVPLTPRLSVTVNSVGRVGSMDALPMPAGHAELGVGYFGDDDAYHVERFEAPSGQDAGLSVLSGLTISSALLNLRSRAVPASGAGTWWAPDWANEIEFFGPRTVVLNGQNWSGIAPILDGVVVTALLAGTYHFVPLLDGGVQQKPVTIDAGFVNSGRITSGYVSEDEVLIATPSAVFVDQHEHVRPAFEDLGSQIIPLSFPPGSMPVGAGPGRTTDTLITLESPNVRYWSRKDAGIFFANPAVPVGAILDGKRISFDGGPHDDGLALLMADGGVMLVYPP